MRWSETKVEKVVRLQQEEINRQKLLAATIEDVYGQRIRGCVDRVRCWKCGTMRWDDGSKCGVCKSRQTEEHHIEEESRAC